MSVARAEQPMSGRKSGSRGQGCIVPHRAWYVPLGMTWACASGEIRAMSIVSAGAPLVVSSARRILP